MMKIFIALALSVVLACGDYLDFLDDEFNSLECRETKESLDTWTSGNFGLEPYKENYILPLGYRQGEYDSYVPSDDYTNIESEIQISLKVPVGYDWFGLGGKYYFAYTHQAFWQVYAESSPFRETNYNPEMFMVLPVEDDDTFVHLRSIKFAFAHKSNGQGNIEEALEDVNTTGVPDALEPFLINRSRSVNYIYSTLTFQHQALISELKLWVPIPENKEDSDNPDLMMYMGYSHLKFRYFHRKHLFTLMGRMNFVNGRGAVEATHSYPLTDEIYLYSKIFSGYGESLIDYDNAITKFSVGFSFSR